tara:strand:+ start:1166 stop:1933 length:768 start_codon:yes stop_codon:yes gene_type:complete
MLRELIREYILLSEETSSVKTHTIVSGDNLSTIANKHNVTVEKIKDSNTDIDFAKPLEIGVTLIIPEGYEQLNKFDKDKNLRNYSAKLEEFIKKKEGKPGTGDHYEFTYDDGLKVPKKWKTEDPIIGNLTIGWGQKQKNLTAQTMKKEEAQVFLDKSLKEASNFLRRSVSKKGYNKPVIPFVLSQNQFDALTSLIFNAGEGNYRNSSLHKDFISKGKIGAPGFETAFKEFFTEHKGNIERRKEEYNIFIGAGYPG